MKKITIVDTSSINWDAVSALLPVGDDEAEYYRGYIDGSKAKPVAQVYFEDDGVTDYVYVLNNGHVVFTINADSNISLTETRPRNVAKFLTKLYKILEDK